MEDFNSDFTTKKQTGFATNRPVRWALTLEEYIANNPEIKAIWHYKTNLRCRKYTDCFVVLDHALFTVHVSIFFNTGIILVDGDHKYWLENEYPKLSVIFETQKEPDNGEQGEPYEKLIDEYRLASNASGRKTKNS